MYYVEVQFCYNIFLLNTGTRFIHGTILYCAHHILKTSKPSWMFLFTNNTIREKTNFYV